MYSCLHSEYTILQGFELSTRNIKWFKKRLKGSLLKNFKLTTFLVLHQKIVTILVKIVFFGSQVDFS